MHESMFYTNVAGCLVALVLALLSGHLVGGVKFSIAQPEVRLPIVAIVGTGPERPAYSRVAFGRGLTGLGAVGRP